MAFLSAEINPKIKVIDLHSENNVDSAVDKLYSELFKLQKEGEQYCRVAHGIGNGILAHKIGLELSKHPAVLSFRKSADGGSSLVILA